MDIITIQIRDDGSLHEVVKVDVGKRLNTRHIFLTNLIGFSDGLILGYERKREPPPKTSELLV